MTTEPYDCLGPGLWQVQYCGGIKPVNEISIKYPLDNHENIQWPTLITINKYTKIQINNSSLHGNGNSGKQK
jgi:hypothetical protein